MSKKIESVNLTQSCCTLIKPNDDTWHLNLPLELIQYQLELENLLHKVFPNGMTCQENLNLAQQLSLNWCASMCQKLGLPTDTCYKN